MTRHVPVFSAASLALVITAAAPVVQAQVFPAQPVRIISSFAAGSGPDVVARIIGKRMGTSWKQSVVVDARPGANEFLAANAVKQAQPTGYDLLLADVGNLSISSSLFKNLPYDPKTDFVPVGGVYRTSFFCCRRDRQPHQVGGRPGRCCSPAFAMNPIGVDFEPADLARRFPAGEDEASIKRRPDSGARGLDSLNLR